MEKDSCGWAGCKNPPEAVLERRPLCRSHFYELAAKRLEDIRTRMAKAGPVGAENPLDNSLDAKFLSEFIGGATGLVAVATSLSESQRNAYLFLSLSAVELYRRLQRHARFEKEVSVILRRGPDPGTWGEFTKTRNVSKKGGCIESGSIWKLSEEIWIERADNRQQGRARVVWVKKTPSLRYLVGVEILECEDFWELG
jgi:hypothetical protein